MAMACGKSSQTHVLFVQPLYDHIHDTRYSDTWLLSAGVGP